jgi:replicative DNA helicase
MNQTQLNLPPPHTSRGSLPAVHKKSILPEQLPPHSIEAERGVLGCILLSAGECLPECIQALRGASDAFFDLRHRALYEILVGMGEKQVAIDLVTLGQWLQDSGQLASVGGLDYLSATMDAVPSAANLAYYLEIVREKHLLRKALYTCSEVIGWIYDSPRDTGALLDAMEERVLRINQDRIQVADARMVDLVRGAQNKIQDLYERQGKWTGIASGYYDLDKKTNGFHGGEMIVIAARPSVGKTSLAMNMAEHIVMDQKLPVGVFSLEMSAESLVLRMLCSRARVNLSLVRDGFLTPQDMDQLALASTALSHAPLYIDDTGGLTILELRAKARRMKQKHNIALFILDYLQLCHSENERAENRQQEIADISNGIKALSKELNVPFIVLSQMNRDYEKEPKKRKPRLSDLRESGAIEQDADFVGLLYHPKDEEDEKAAPPEARGATEVNLLIAKHRNGPCGEVLLTFFKSITRFQSAAKIDSKDVPFVRK